jgi:hypothetical protein
LRSAWVTLEPITVWITLVSVVSRESTSPVRVTSKKPGERRITCAKTSRRRSATTRSPIQVTR